MGTVVVPAHRRARGGRRPLPKAFPRVEIIHELEDGDCPCGDCKAALTPISEKVTELPQATSVEEIETFLPVSDNAANSARGS